jgi:hypothetical protein
LYEGGVEPFFDYIVRISGLPVDSIEAHQVGPLFESKKGRPVELSLYSLRTRGTRDVVIVPRPGDVYKGVLGGKLKWDSMEAGSNQGVFVKKVLPNSPASHALRPRDFLFAASPSGAPIGDLGDLETLIAEAGVREAPLELFVFNADDETFRTASVDLTIEWSGEGRLGAEFAHGVFEGIPHAKKAPVPRVVYSVQVTAKEEANAPELVAPPNPARPTVAV